jgi:heterotetrameric sarcosine oxidase gamma subunit
VSLPEPDRLSPLQRSSGEAAVLRCRDLVVEERPFIEKIILRGGLNDDAFIAAFRAAFRVEPPPPCGSTDAGSVMVLRIGSTEWLAVETRGSGRPGELRERLEAAGLITTDVGSASTVLQISGRDLDGVLRRLSALPCVGLPAGNVTRRRIGRLAILVHAIAPDRLDLYVPRSYARSFIEQLRDAAEMSR